MTKTVKVTNRSQGYTGYQIPDSNVTRIFTPGESKNLPLEELQQLQWVAGGEYVLRNALIINDRDALSALNMEDVEPEYFYTEEDIRKLLDSGSLDQLEDALNFAPAGVIELIQKIAVETEVPDIRKRNMISEKTGFNINNAINVNHVMSDETEKKDEGPTKRKAAPINQTEEPAPAEKPVRKYNFVTSK